MLTVDQIQQLLGRPEPPLTSVDTVQGKAVAITGAGGSIGSHLTKVVANLKPSRLLLIENNEFRLYDVHRRLAQSIAVPVLSSYGHFRRMKMLFEEFGIDTVFHVGAYKHVPLVERNPVAAVENNVKDAWVLFDACGTAGVKNLTVVSSDKAVRPSSVMGATKAMVEAVALAHPLLAGRVRVVRFGNVMWSSGSVLPLFYEQLSSGKVVTITDPEVDRYFMTVQQAVGLIIQASSMPGGIYVLDMGQPVKIVDLVARMAQIMGVSEYSVKYVGLRDGEKLHEELTLGDNLHATDHHQVFEAREQVRSWGALVPLLNDLMDCCDSHDVAGVRAKIQEFLPTYSPVCGILDDLWLEKYVVKGQNLLDGDCFLDTPEPV